VANSRTDGNERRNAPRRCTRLRPARIADLDDHFLCDGIVRDLSATGARIAVRAEIRLPARFQIYFETDGLLAQVRLAWRRGNEAGVSFVSPPTGIQALTRQSARALARSHYALTPGGLRSKG